MSPLPTQLLLGNLTYTVTEDADEWAERGVVGIVHSTTYGATNHHKLLILINPAQAQPQKADTLLHEVLHCIWEISSIPRCNELSDQANHEEMSVGHLTPWLLHVLRMNPELMDYLEEPE